MVKSTFQKVQISKFRAFFIPRLALSKFVEESPLYRFPNFFFVLPPPPFFSYSGSPLPQDLSILSSKEDLFKNRPDKFIHTKL